MHSDQLAQLLLFSKLSICMNLSLLAIAIGSYMVYNYIHIGIYTYWYIYILIYCYLHLDLLNGKYGQIQIEIYIPLL